MATDHYVPVTQITPVLERAAIIYAEVLRTTRMDCVIDPAARSDQKQLFEATATIKRLADSEYMQHDAAAMHTPQ